MNSFWSGLFVISVLVSSANPSLSEPEHGSVIAPATTAAQRQRQDTNPELALSTAESVAGANNLRRTLSQGRSLDTVDDDDEEETKSKPLRKIFMGIYKNYKSTYLGNKTLTEYKQSLRETMKNKQQKLIENESIRDDIEEEKEEQELEPEPEQDELSSIPFEPEDDDADEARVTDYPDNLEDVIATTSAVVQSEKEEDATELSAIHKRKRKVSPLLTTKEAADTLKQEQQHYNIGPALNMSLDLNNSIVKVNLDGESLKELVTGRWLSDSSEEGRGKKYEMVTRILPLFILPFLIQSAIVPFLVTKLKLLLMKSMLVGKLAIFLLIISAFKNSNKPMQTYEVAPSYWAGEPSRRSEIAAAASNMAYNGYRVEGKPTAWIN